MRVTVGEQGRWDRIRPEQVSREHVAGAPEPNDKIEGAWTREQLERTDQRFCERVERAIAAGQCAECFALSIG
jgi:hypothetical protein